MNLSGKAALVTGGAMRIGRAICEALADEGCRVLIHFNRSHEQAESLALTLEQRGEVGLLVQGDLAMPGKCEEVIEKSWDLTGGLDILVNNAGVYRRDALLDCDEETIMRQFRPNLLAPILLTRALARCVTTSQDDRTPVARVVNMLDRRITSNEAGCLPYLLSKKMLAEFTRSAALELAPAITVNAVAPGAVLPPPGERNSGNFAEIAAGNPLHHRCTAEEVAQAVVSLVKQDAVTGQVVFVDGGAHLL